MQLKSNEPIEEKDQVASRRLVRLLKYVKKLSSRHYKTKELAGEFNICKRTVYRDIAVLKEAEVLVIYEESKGYIIADKSLRGSF